MRTGPLVGELLDALGKSVRGWADLRVLSDFVATPRTALPWSASASAFCHPLLDLTILRCVETTSKPPQNRHLRSSYITATCCWHRQDTVVVSTAGWKYPDKWAVRMIPCPRRFRPPQESASVPRRRRGRAARPRGVHQPAGAGRERSPRPHEVSRLRTPMLQPTDEQARRCPACGGHRLVQLPSWRGELFIGLLAGLGLVAGYALLAIWMAWKGRSP